MENLIRMLTPNDIHLIVGIFCNLTTPENVSIVLGDMVYDSAAEKERDVDITISYKNEKGEEISFVGFEVKDEKRPLGVQEVEQLCIKFKDMESVKKGGIVSASGYTKPAIKKAKYHNIELYDFKNWESNGRQLSHVRFSKDFKLNEIFNSWIAPPKLTYIFNEELSQAEMNAFSPSCKVADRNGGALKNGIKTLGELSNNLIQQALNNPTINAQIENKLIGEQIPLNIIMEVTDCSLIMENEKLLQINKLNINGILIKVQRETKTIFKILVKLSDNNFQVGSTISELSNGLLIGLATSNEDQSIKLIWVPVPDRLKNKIYRNKLK